jgi:putative tryptophan/tyrosine transport system substrate-binding protein
MLPPKQPEAGMRRREFLGLVGSFAGVTWPIAAHTQEAGRIYRLGFLTARPRAIPEYDAFFDELRRNGFIEGQNLIVDARGFGPRHEQFAEIAAENVRRPSRQCSGLFAILCESTSPHRADDRAAPTGNIPMARNC